jgi:ABC-type multidrug transport system fused ATPase/permease subunit
LSFKDVAFSYQETKVLNTISFDIIKGSRVGITGVTGSGKSTLADLMMGLLPPDSGQILVHGVPLDDSTRRVWHTHLAHVPQSVYLSDTTIGENVALGRHEDLLDVERIWRALEHAQLAEWVKSLPEGINTSVGERGVRLSGGQRQRIGIARALYKEADVLFLDEATSALDDNTESAVMDTIYALNPDITLFVIAHRTSTLNRCTHLLHVEEGTAELKYSTNKS